MRLSDGSRTPKKWEKPLGVFLIILGYLILAAGIVLACFSFIPKEWRIASPCGAIVLYALLGFVGYILTDLSVSDFKLQRRREWKALSGLDRFIFVTTYPCRLVLSILEWW